MARYDHLREIAVLPCLPPGLSIEDSFLDRTGPCFDLQFAQPNDAFARMLAFLNVSKRHFVDLVIERRGINLLSAKPQGRESGPYRYRGEYAREWRAMTVPHDRKRPALLTDDQFVEILENASHGGQLAIAGYVRSDVRLPKDARAIRLTGRFQIGVIDYIWGSGHTITIEGPLTVDMSGGQLIDAPGYPFDGVCDFALEFFLFDTITPATPPRSRRFHAGALAS